MKKYYVTVNGNRYEVEVEEVKGEFESAAAVSQNKAPQTAQTQIIEPSKPIKNEEQTKEPEVKVMPSLAPQNGEKIECPMPGTILKVNVKDGDNIKKGEVMFVLEAMKMENEIMAPRDCKIISVNTSKGTVVNTGDILAVIQ